MLLSESAEHPKLHYLLGKPGFISNLGRYGRAKQILHSTGIVTLIEEDEAADFGTQLETCISGAEGITG